MRHLRTLGTLAAAAAVALTTAPTAFAKNATIGDSAGQATTNICLASIDCTYVNYRQGKAVDVIRRNGTLTDWSLSAGSVGGQVQLRILRPTGHGRYRIACSSALRTVTQTGLNTFPAHIRVRAGDVLALSNSSSGIYMTEVDPGTSVHYFSPTPSTGTSAKPNQIASGLHVMLSAHVRS